MMRRTVIAAFCLTAALAAQTKAPATPQEIKTFYESGLRRNGIIGSSLMLIRNGEVVLDDNYGRQS